MGGRGQLQRPEYPNVRLTVVDSIVTPAANNSRGQ